MSASAALVLLGVVGIARSAAKPKDEPDPRGSAARRKPPKWKGHPRRTESVTAPVRASKKPGARTEVWVPAGDPTPEGTIEWVRRRPSRWAGMSVNADDSLPWKDYAWLEEGRGGPECRICGGRMREERYGITWGTGEGRVRGRNPKGGYRSRGSVLWAMRAAKFEEFGMAHLPCADAFRDPRNVPPPDIVWLVTWAGASVAIEELLQSPAKMADAWKAWKGREETWTAPVRRHLLEAFKAGGGRAVDSMVFAGVGYRHHKEGGGWEKRYWPGLFF